MFWTPDYGKAQAERRRDVLKANEASSDPFSGLFSLMWHLVCSIVRGGVWLVRALFTWWR